MTTPGSWNETAAGLLVNHGLTVELPFEARRREFESIERRQAIADFQAAVDADAQWKFSRQLQQQLAARGWTGNWVDVGPAVPAALQPLHDAAAAASSVTWAQPRKLA